MSVLCGTPTPTGPCRRPVATPGAPCGATHPAAGGTRPPAGTAPAPPTTDPLHPSNPTPTPAGIVRGALGGDAAYLADEAAPLGRVEAPVAPVEVITDDQGWVTIDRVAVSWGDLGEGHAGDYDPDDPTDEPLLRFELEVRRFHGGGWIPMWSDGYCTSVSRDADERTRVGGLARIARLVCDAAGQGSGVSAAAAAGSWTSTEDAVNAADRYAAADPGADPALLDRLAAHPDPEVRAAVAANPAARPAARAHAGLLAD